MVREEAAAPLSVRSLLAALVALAALIAPAPAGAILGGGAVTARSLRGVVRVDLPDDVCSGSLITSRVVLTALHCVQAPENGVSPNDLGRQAQITVGNPNHGGRTQVRGVSLVYVAPQVFPPPAVTHQVDTALLVLDRAVREPPTRLAPPGEVGGLIVPGAPLVVSGFGAVVAPPPNPDGTYPTLQASSILKAAALTGAPCPPSDGGASAYLGCASPAPGALGPVPTGNSCLGDSGAPVLAPSPSAGGALSQIGVLSGAEGPDQCSQTDSTVFTPLNAALARWLGAVLATPLPASRHAPRKCRTYKRELRRARHRASHAHGHSRASARRKASKLAVRVYRYC